MFLCSAGCGGSDVPQKEKKKKKHKAALNSARCWQLCCFLPTSDASVVYVSVLISRPVSARGSADRSPDPLPAENLFCENLELLTLDILVK